MARMTTAQFRRTLSSTIDIAQREPVEILSRGVRLRAVLVSADFYQRAIEALEEEPYVLPPLSREEERRREDNAIWRSIFG